MRSGSIIHKTDSKDWTFIVSESSRGNYMCQCRSRDDWYSPTMWGSKAIKLSVAAGKPKVQLSAYSLEIPGRVTLTCSVTPSSIGWKYYWYRDEKSADPLMTQEPVFSPNELKSVSEKSLYWCRGGRGEPVYYTDYSNPITISNNVTVSNPVSFSIHVMLIVGPVSGVILIILLLLWRSYKWSMGENFFFSSYCFLTSSLHVCFEIELISVILLSMIQMVLSSSPDLCSIRSFQSESSSQRPTTNHGVNQTESDYSFLLHGTTSVYETIHNCGATGKERLPDPEVGSVYVNVRPDNYSSA
ncbi:uncharacterized protein LOC114157048 [Xiphophorus couchianus]|uniref:uncharacterized protein LOC114157048 n=1 Tax=Xiphophorus couchianus TaxID=32473 RepID=UPI0010166312|nr:uncharacterized protein LOC114157048 [Xiphophorus couchianus]